MCVCVLYPLASDGHEPNADHGLDDLRGVLVLNLALEAADRVATGRFGRDVARTHAGLARLLPAGHERLGTRALVPPHAGRAGRQQRQERVAVDIVCGLLEGAAEERERRQVLVRRAVTEGHERGGKAEGGGQVGDGAGVQARLEGVDHAVDEADDSHGVGHARDVGFLCRGRLVGEKQRAN